MSVDQLQSCLSVINHLHLQSIYLLFAVLEFKTRIHTEPFLVLPLNYLNRSRHMFAHRVLQWLPHGNACLRVSGNPKRENGGTQIKNWAPPTEGRAEQEESDGVVMRAPALPLVGGGLQNLQQVQPSTERGRKVSPLQGAIQRSLDTTMGNSGTVAVTEQERERRSRIQKPLPVWTAAVVNESFVFQGNVYHNW